MKTSIALIAVVCIVGVYSHCGRPKPDEDKMAKIRTDVEQCATASGLDKSIIDDIKANKKVPPSHEFNCFQACVLKKIGIMNEDGTIKPGEATEPEAKKDCKKQSGADACETAHLVMECFQKNDLLPKFHP